MVKITAVTKSNTAWDQSCNVGPSGTTCVGRHGTRGDRPRIRLPEYERPYRHRQSLSLAWRAD
eukprot:3418474-Pyramimonas_sp.AAC.1